MSTSELNSYYGIGKNNYLYASEHILEHSMSSCYNADIVLFSEASENLLKSVVELFLNDVTIVKLLNTHNQRALYNKVVEKYSLSITIIECKWLGDFYFDARYPGDNFMLAAKEDALQCKALVESLLSDVDKIHALIKEERVNGMLSFKKTSNVEDVIQKLRKEVDE